VLTVDSVYTPARCAHAVGRSRKHMDTGACSCQAWNRQNAPRFGEPRGVGRHKNSKNYKNPGFQSCSRPCSPGTAYTRLSDEPMRSAVPEHTWTQVLAPVKPGIDQTRRGLSIRAGSTGPEISKNTKTLNFRPAGARAYREQRIYACPMSPYGWPSQNTHGHRCLQLSSLESTKRAAVWRSARGRPDQKFQKLQKP
jgi:hypothetical protein